MSAQGVKVDKEKIKAIRDWRFKVENLTLDVVSNAIKTQKKSDWRRFKVKKHSAANGKIKF